MVYAKILTKYISNLTKDKRYKLFAINEQICILDDKGVTFPTRFIPAKDWAILDDRKDRY